MHQHICMKIFWNIIYPHWVYMATLVLTYTTEGDNGVNIDCQAFDHNLS